MKVRLKCIFLLVSLFLPLSFTLFPPYVPVQESQGNIYGSAEDIVEIEIRSDPDPLEDGVYLIGAELRFLIEKQGYNTLEIIIEDERRVFTLTLNEGADYWVVRWNTEELDDPIAPGEYQLTLLINGEERNSNPDTIIFSTGEDFPFLLIIIIVIAIAGLIGFGAFYVMRQKKMKGDKVEMSKVEKRRKKRGKIYSGASAIGKRSGKIAESKKKVKSPSESKQGREEQSTKARANGRAEIFKDVDTPFGISKKKKALKSKPERKGTSTDFDLKISGSKSAAMMKKMELGMDIGEKTRFLTSKVESILSNIEFFKTILSKKKQTRLMCPECEKIASKYWTSCAHCSLEQYDLELGLEQSLVSLSGDVGFCTSCKRIIKPEWNKCPYCFIKNNS
ncbi:MAG: hypothetical protein ACOC44_15930 [Promethearchaeia archaeon]